MAAQKRKTEVPQYVKDLGRRIRRVRKEANLSIEKIAYKAEIDAQNLRKYELGKQEKKVSMLKRIAEALDMTVSELVKDL